MACAGLILAAGEGRRAGGPKALLKLEGKTFLEIAIGHLRQAGLDPVVAVLGARAGEIRKVVDRQGALLADNPDWPRGMFSSLQVGLRALAAEQRGEPGPEGVVVSLVDHPFVQCSTIRRLLESFDPAEVDALLPRHRGRSGHPVLLGRRVLDAVLEADRDATLRDLLFQKGVRVKRLEVDDPGILKNINRAQDLAGCPR